VTQNAACPDCTWTIVAVIGRVDFVSLAGEFKTDSAGRFKTGVSVAGPLCKCARCGAEFYVAQGQVHRWMVGIDKRQEPAPRRTGTTGAPTNAVAVDFTPRTDLRPPPD
jgi:hypothetical protein